MSDFKARTDEDLDILEDDESKGYIGRKSSIHDEYGEDGALLLGKSVDTENYGQHIYMDAVSPHVVGIFGARGSGKCLKPGEKVLTESGELKKIEDIFKNVEGTGTVVQDTEKEKLVKSNEEIKIPALNEDFKTTTKEITHVYRKKVNEKLIKIKTKTGKEITTTKTHPLLTINEKTTWKETEKLKEEDFIALPRQIHTKPEENQFLRQQLPKTIQQL